MEGGDIEGGERQWKVDRQKRPEENRQSIERAVDRYSGSRNVEYLAWRVALVEKHQEKKSKTKERLFVCTRIYITYSIVRYCP